jgi:hypothetical protein
MMILELGLFFFVLLGSKVLLGAVAVYMLLPQDPKCVICDAEMLPIECAPGTGRLFRLLRLQRRWCMECRRETLARRHTSLRAVSTSVAGGPVVQPRVR